MGWNDGHQVDGQDARRKDEESRFIYSGQGHAGGRGHGEIESYDGINASYVREPGGRVIVNQDREDPYAPYQSDVERHNFRD